LSSQKKLTVFIYKEKMGIKVPPRELVERVRRDTVIKNKIMNAIKNEPKTVPEIAEITGLRPDIVLWYISTFLRYGLVEKVEKTLDGYWKYIWKEK